MSQTLAQRALEYAFIKQVDRLFERLCRDIEGESLNAVRSPAKSTAIASFNKSFKAAQDAHSEASDGR